MSGRVVPCYWIHPITPLDAARRKDLIINDCLRGRQTAGTISRLPNTLLFTQFETLNLGQPVAGSERVAKNVASRRVS